MTLPFHLMLKPVGPRCNLACRYCFYLEKPAVLDPAAPPRMTPETLEACIAAIAAARPGPIMMAFQGGEPTLAGLPFFEQAVEIAARICGDRPVQWTLQTNGLLLDDAWCRFLARHRFLVGLSLDGPAGLHDAFRVGRRGEPSSARAVAAWRRLRDHGVECNVLTAVHAANDGHPLEVYEFLLHLGARHLQFIPVVEREPDAAARSLGLRLGAPGGGAPRLTPWSVRPAAYGAFLTQIFDAWVARDVGRISIQIVESCLANRLGLGGAVCQFAPECGRSLIVETHGDVYACDHYVYPPYRRGRIGSTPLVEILDDPAQVRFGRDKADRLPYACRCCEVLAFCHGDCPKHRMIIEPDEPNRPRSVLCAAYRPFFNHIWPVIDRLCGLLREGRPPAEIMSGRAPGGADRNAPCPCGSGRKFKHCCGRPSAQT